VFGCFNVAMALANDRNNGPSTGSLDADHPARCVRAALANMVRSQLCRSR